MLDINKLFKELFVQPKYEFPSVFGDFKTETGSDENGDWKKQTYQSKDGSTKIVTFYRTISNENNELLSLKNEMKTAVSLQDYEKAITLRGKIRELENSQTKIFELEKDLARAVDTEDFELAIKLRDKLKNLKTK